MKYTLFIYFSFPFFFLFIYIFFLAALINIGKQGNKKAANNIFFLFSKCILFCYIQIKLLFFSLFFSSLLLYYYTALFLAYYKSTFFSLTSYPFAVSSIFFFNIFRIFFFNPLISIIPTNTIYSQNFILSKLPAHLLFKFPLSSTSLQ